MVEEIYKPIVGYESSYEVSNYGNVRSLDRVTTGLRNKRNRDSHYKARPMNSYIAGSGYPAVTLRVNSVGKSCTMHRLVAIAHIPNPGNKPVVNHLDGNKLNNHITNLEWCTARENVIHAYQTGLKRACSGDRNKNTKLTDNQAINIFHMKGSMSENKIGKLYGVTGHYIYTIHNGSMRKHLKLGQL